MDSESTSSYLYLNFNGRINNLLKEAAFINFKIFNLDTETPIVKINENFYEGKYDEAMGTNIYFTEGQTAPNPDPCKPNTPIALTYLIHQTEVLNLKRIGSAVRTTSSEKTPTTNENKPIKISFKDNYWELIEKHKQGTLNVEDYIGTEDREDSITTLNIENNGEGDSLKTLPPCNELELPPSNKTMAKWYTDGIEVFKGRPIIPNMELNTNRFNLSRTFLTYLQLQTVAKQSKSWTAVSFKTRFNGRRRQSGRKAWNVRKVKRVFISHLSKSLQCAGFKTGELADLVDIEQSIKDRVIAAQPFPWDFTEAEIESLLSVVNFKNLSFWMKFMIVTDATTYYENQIATQNLRELFIKDSDGFCILQKYDIFHTVRRKVMVLVKQHLRNVSYELKIHWDEILLKSASPSPRFVSQIEKIRCMFKLNGKYAIKQ